MIIAAFTPDLTDAVCRLILPIQREEFGVPVTLEGQPDLLDIPTFYQADGGFWVAVEDGLVIGSIGLKRFGDAAALRKMFVRHDFRGSAHGVGQGLLDRLLAFAKAEGLDAIWLGTTEKFLAAHRFYEKNGFTRVPPEALPPTFPRVAVDTVFYRKTLA
ncbi:GNAT family N-acetyltransferase [soil metagenome]